MWKGILLGGIIGLLLMRYKTAWAIPTTGQPYAAALMNAEKSYNIPHNLLARVAYQESRFRDDIITGKTISDANAQGIMQIVPKWHPDVDPLKPYDAINYAGMYLANLYQRFGSWDKALAAYNWGPTILSSTIKEHGNQWLDYAPRETANYVSEILEDVPV
jgi:soluble lytic murein transglycosylase-like protein